MYTPLIAQYTVLIGAVFAIAAIVVGVIFAGLYAAHAGLWAPNNNGGGTRQELITTHFIRHLALF